MTDSFEQAWTALHEELEEWPGFHLVSLQAGSSAGSRGPSGEMPPDPKQGWWRSTYSGSWCATAAKDGWAEREWNQERFFQWAATPALAMDRVREEMHRYRTDPHYGHISDHEFLPGCAECQTDWKVRCGYEETEGPLTDRLVYAP